jgi:dTDP-glucose 4,6-dehydratase
MNKMTYVITGGAGFIGSNFIYYMLSKRPDARIVCFDSLTYAGHKETLENAMSNGNFSFVKGDITDTAAVDLLFEKFAPDVIVNFAAESHVDRSIDDPGLFLRTNIIGTQVLLEVCKKHKISRFHQVSTDEVYGELPVDRKDLLFTENTPLDPHSPYSVSKTAADLLALSYFRTYGVPVTISRCSNNYGPYQFPEKLIPVMILKALADESLPVYGNGKNIRDWLWVDDHCSAIDAIIEKGKHGEIYNIGGNTELTNIDIVKLIIKKLDKPESLIKYVADRPGHDLRYAIDAGKIKEHLGWTPSKTFADGINETIDWYINNTDWVKKVLL